MAYNNFTKEKVFSNQNANVNCNLIYNALIDKFDTPLLDTDFCITGTVSKLIQGATLSPINVTPFITSSAAVYNYCSNELPKLLGATAVKYKDRVQMVFNTQYFEFWFDDDLGTINTVSGFKVQDTADISPKID